MTNEKKQEKAQDETQTMPALQPKPHFVLNVHSARHVIAPVKREEKKIDG